MESTLLEKRNISPNIQKLKLRKDRRVLRVTVTALVAADKFKYTLRQNLCRALSDAEVVPAYVRKNA